MTIIKADLCCPTMSFEPYWIRGGWFRKSYKGKNLLQILADTCFSRGIDICALTSISDQVDEKGVILRNSPHDKLGFLEVKFAQTMPKDYKTERLDKDLIVVERGGELVYFINGQIVIVMDKSRDYNPIAITDEGRHHHIVIGSNEVPNFKTFAETLAYCNDNKLLHGLRIPRKAFYFGAGEEIAAMFAKQCDFIEGHNPWLTPEQNKSAQEFALKFDKAWISVSNAKSLESAGVAYIKFDGEDIDGFDRGDIKTVSSVTILRDLRHLIGINAFDTHIGYHSRDDFKSFKREFGIYMLKKKTGTKFPFLKRLPGMKRLLSTE